ncbi:carbohydrate ABC transporter permease [Cohnella ginsengisoli]|uniref:Carbohydrate ABC transporter permease n=1 Tax=Cohnella ginsengisoli TaxID=425004 RepID=A0A9X4KIB9_9BACL|nr:carbohydrate ABC transporter permease [Cohnella ginsengisoli]MDG0792361.1 carbohydrate ABC transporter permease [Cohnella ginsengisoli]
MKIALAICKYLFVFVIVLLSLGPFLWMFMASFKTNAEILTNSLAWPSHFRFSNYSMAFKIAPLSRFYINSVIVGILGTAVNLLILGMSAYVLARFQFRGKKLLTVLLSLSLLIPGAAMLQPLYLTVNTIGLYDKLIGLIIVYAGFGLPVSLYILSSYFLTIPKEMEESAYLDGAGFIRTFFKIILPISRPGFGTAAVLQFLLCWNEFQFAIILTTGNQSRTLPLALYYFKSQFASDYGVMFAATMVVILPSILVYILMQRQVISGLAAGAVKG